MSSQVAREVAPHVKRELTQAEERTEAGKFLQPVRGHPRDGSHRRRDDGDAGRRQSSIDIQLDKGVLTVKGTIDSTKYESSAAAVHGVQRRQLRSDVHGVAEGRRNGHLRGGRRRCADDRAAESEGSADAAHLRQLKTDNAAMDGGKCRPQNAPAFAALGILAVAIAGANCGRRHGWRQCRRAYSSANASNTLPGEPTIPPLPAVT